MSNFFDSEHRTWMIDLKLATIDAIKANTQVDLIPDNNDCSKIAELCFDSRKLAAVLWDCIREQAESKQIDRKLFYSALDGTSLARGWEALVDAIVFFIRQQNPQQAAMVEEMIRVQFKVMEAGAVEMIKRMSSEETDKAIRDLLNRLGEEMQQGIAEALENSASNSEASLGYTPELGPFASSRKPQKPNK
jgi:hypothetical protein